MDKKTELDPRKLISKDFIISTPIPKVKKQPKTFLGIAKQPHYENVSSNIFAFFFDPKEEHRFGRLFIDTLLEIINENEKYSDFVIHDFDVYTEYGTKEGGRIDILLKSDDAHIIIENKIYHWLNNDLKDYWDSSAGNRRVGIVFSNFPIHKTGHNWFFNLTHLAFLERVMKNKGKYEAKNTTKFSYFLDDLYQNTINLSVPIMKQEDISFFFEHQQKIEATIAFKNQLIEHIKGQIGQVHSGLNRNLSLSRRGNKYNYFHSLDVHNLMFTIVFEDLLSKKRELFLIIELWGDELKAVQSWTDLKEHQLVKRDFFKNVGRDWDHLVARRYKLNMTEITDLSKFILDKLEKEGFLSLFDQLENKLHPKHNTHV